MKLIFTGGGTGGHIQPALAVAQALKRKRSGAEIVWIGSNKGLEKLLVSSHNFKFYAITTGKLRRYLSFQNFLDSFRVLRGVFQSIGILKKEKPDLVFAKGGYVSVPVAIAARIRKIPVVIHESDSVPGLATKVMARFAGKICLSFADTKRFFPGKNTVFTGNPIRTTLMDGSKEEGYRLTKFTSQKPVLFITGGSTGALSINLLIKDTLPLLTQYCQIVHQTGTGKEIDTSKLENTEIHSNYRQYEYLDQELKHIYAIADLVVARAGANNLSELAALGKPAIAIPLPSSASDHQLKNAREFAKQGACVLLEEKELTPEKLLFAVKSILTDEAELKKLSINIRNLANIDAAEKVAQEILGVVVKS